MALKLFGLLNNTSVFKFTMLEHMLLITDSVFHGEFSPQFRKTHAHQTHISSSTSCARCWGGGRRKRGEFAPRVEFFALLSILSAPATPPQSDI